jgi:exopolyphosphatase/guanosine-5'-triphosphate,3'-diphosphate pyrophosphatase
MGNAIIPRWEWRTFGTHFGPAEEHLAGLTPTGVQRSQELYIISVEGDTVKVRDELMDIKLLREVGVGGLERWEPVLKEPFPLAPQEVASVLEALCVPVPELAREQYTLEQLLAEVIDPQPALRTVPVSKHRVRYTIEGCIGELSDVETGHGRTRTIAIESEDIDAVVAAVRAVGLEPRVNTSYPRGLGAIYDGEPPRYAAIDVGTNSVKLHIGQVDRAGTWTALLDRAEVTQLGEGLAESGAIGQPALTRTAEAIRGMMADARSLLVREVAAVGTAGLRSASNRAEVVAAIDNATGVGIEVISGVEESRLAYVAALAALGTPPGDSVVFDTGGGSSQFTFGDGATVREAFSVDVGAVRFTKAHGLAGVVPPAVLDAARADVAVGLGALDGRPAVEQVIGMGGAITNMTAVSLAMATYDPEVVQGHVLTRAEVERQIELYAGIDEAQRRQVVGLQSKRAGVILAGACIVAAVMDALGVDRLTVSDRGLRHGLIVERFGHGEVEAFERPTQWGGPPTR